jgi:probable rRNA maturation factor
MPVTLKNLQTKIPLNPRLIKSLLNTTLELLDLAEANVSVVFVSHQKMRALNHRYFHLRNTTDVLAFDVSADASKNISWEVVVSPDAAKTYVRLNGGDVADELMLYMVHGILHLAGYDDHREADIQQMRDKERFILSTLGTRVKHIVGMNSISGKR